jgi:NAD(P)-dependent dehydrogenase (short-subunit alcohol dehydrogenase family)
MKAKTNRFDVSGKIAIVTGGLGLLGNQFVKTLIENKARVVIFDLKEQTLPSLAKCLQIDITDKKQVMEAMDFVEIQIGVPSILINNAGLDSMPDSSTNENCAFEDYKEETWNTVINSHLKGAFLVSQAFVKKLKSSRKSGSIINVSSTYGLVSPDQSVYDYRRQKGEIFYKPVTYSVAKAGMIGFTKWLAEYCAQFGIRVNTLAPGGVFNNQNPEFVEEYEKRTMLGRMANASDYNAAILFLASDASSYMTGATLVIDGGWTAR